MGVGRAQRRMLASGPFLAPAGPDRRSHQQVAAQTAPAARGRPTSRAADGPHGTSARLPRG